MGLAGWVGVPSQAAPVETAGFLKYECWFPSLRDESLTGTAVYILESDPNYQSNTADLVSYVAGMDTRPVFPDDSHEQYGARLSGWITPTTTGDYHFYLASDDASQLWISIDDTEVNLQLAAEETGCCHGFLEPGASQTTFSPLHLVAGQKYAVRILLKEGTGNDYVQVAWQEANGTTPAALLKPLASTVLSSSADPTGASLSISQQPVPASTPENMPVSFSIAATGTTPYGQYSGGGAPAAGSSPPLGTKSQLALFYQWFTNGVEVPGANGTNFTIPWPKKAQDNGKKVKCYVAVPGVPLYSSEVTLTVTSDTTPPTVVQAAADISFTNIVVTYSEPVSDSALVPSNYTLDQGLTITSVSRVDLLTVQLQTSKMAENRIYNLTIRGVQDTASPANPIAANAAVSFRSYVFLAGSLLHKKYNNISDNAGWPVSNLLTDSRYPNNPDRVDLELACEYPPGGVARIAAADPVRNYFDSIEGYFIPSATTNYVFLTAGADRIFLYLSTDDTPANMHQITSLNGWTNPRGWNQGQGGTDMTPTRSDSYAGTAWPDGNTVSLTKGQRYYMLMIHHDPGWSGADDFAATYKFDSEPDPAVGDAPKLSGSVVGYYFDPTGASINFVQQPKNANAVQGAAATFTVAANGTSAYGTTVLFQWQTAPKGSTTWTDIPGAIGTSYTTSLLALTDDGKQYRVVATLAPITATSEVAIVTVTADTTPPVVSVGAMQDATAGTVDIGVGFNKPMDEASLRVLANYSVSGGTISSVTVYSNRFTANSQNPLAKVLKQSVLLKVTGVSTSGSLTVKNLADTYGNKISATTVPFTVSTAMQWGVVGANELNGINAVVPAAANGYDIYSDGIAEWANYDEATFVYEQITGDFDKQLRVQYQDGSSQWSRAGLIVRDVTNFGVDRAAQVGSGASAPPYDGKAGRYQKCLATPVGATLTGPGNPGAQDFEGNRRLDTGGATTSAGGGGTPLYRNAWCRIQRVGQKFTIYRSDDGVNWVSLGSTTWGVDDETKTLMPDTVYVGPEFAPENGNITTPDQGTFLAQIRDYGNYAAGFDPQLKIQADATGKATLTWTTGTLVSSPTAQGPYSPITGAASPYTVAPSTGTTFYRVMR